LPAIGLCFALRLHVVGFFLRLPIAKKLRVRDPGRHFLSSLFLFWVLRPEPVEYTHNFN
jgi:hypothetical protein